MVEVMLVRYVNINARCRASGVLVPLACVVGDNLNASVKLGRATL